MEKYRNYKKIKKIAGPVPFSVLPLVSFSFREFHPLKLEAAGKFDPIRNIFFIFDFISLHLIALSNF